METDSIVLTPELRHKNEHETRNKAEQANDLKEVLNSNNSSRKTSRPINEKPKLVKQEINNQSFGSYENQNLLNDCDRSKMLAKEEYSPVSPFKYLTRLRENIDILDQKRFDSPFKEFCAKLSPIQSRQQTPLSFKKNSINKSNEYVLFLNSPGQFIKPNSERSPLYPQPRRYIQKLDFNDSKIRLIAQNDEIKIENDTTKREDMGFLNRKPVENIKLEENFDGKADDHSPNFNRLQKSRYTSKNPMPVKSNIPVSKHGHDPVFTPLSNISDDDHHLINPKLLKEKNHFVQSTHNLRSYSTHLDSGETRDDETISPSRVQKTKICLETMNSLDKLEFLFTSRKNLSNIYNAPIMSPSDQKADEEHDEAASISIAGPEAKRVACNCKKSKCLKLYCDCFAANEFCGPDCNCANCYNNDDHRVERKSAMDGVLERNPTAFQPKVEKAQPAIEKGVKDNKIRHQKGCNCKKSGCLKKYCECFAAGVKCSELCKCETCKNMDPSACKKKMHNLLSMSMNSQDKLTHQRSDSQDDSENNPRQRHLRREEEEYEGRVTRKKLKAAPHQIDSFNTFGGTNMINELLKKKNRKEDSDTGAKVINLKSEGELVYMNPNSNSQMINYTKADDPRIINFSDEEMSGEKIKKHLGRKYGNLRSFSNICSDIIVKGEQ